MIRLYPDNAAVQLEFDKVQQLVQNYCHTAYAAELAANLRIHTHADYIIADLNKANEYRYLLVAGQRLPVDFYKNIQREIKLLSIPGAMLGGDQLVLLRKLLENTDQLFRWFDADRQPRRAADRTRT